MAFVDERPQRWINYGQEGDCAFATTTCLDVVHALAPIPCRDLMALSLLDDCKRYEIFLTAYVVMPHHVHFVAQVPEGKTVGWMLNRIKSNSARRVLRVLPGEIKERFSEQRGLNQRSFWKVRYRSIVVTHERMFRQKISYTHKNPLEAGYCNDLGEYKWSSAQDWQNERWNDLRGLNLEACAQRFRHMEPYLQLSSLTDE